MAKKRKTGAAEVVEESQPENGASAQDLKALLERNQDGVLVVDGQQAVRYANSAAARLLKQKLPKLLAGRFEHELAEGAMRTIDLHMKVEPLEWDGQPATFVVLRPLASQQSAFHVEWRIEAAEERAREYEEKVRELEERLAQAPAVVEGEPDARVRDLEAELQSTLDRALEAEQAAARAERRAEEAEREVHQAEERARAAEVRAHEAEALMEEAEAQALEAERTLEDTGDSVRELEEKFERACQQAREAEERAAALARELDLSHQGKTDAAELAAVALEEAEQRCREAQGESARLRQELNDALERLSELESLVSSGEEQVRAVRESASGERQQVQAQLLEAQERLAEVEQQLAEARLRAESVEGAGAAIAQARAVAEEARVAAETRLAEAEEARAAAEAQRVAAEEARGAVEGRLAEAEEARAAAEAQRVAAEEARGAVEARLAAAEEARAAAEAQLAAALAASPAVEGQLAQAEEARAAAEARVADVEAARLALEVQWKAAEEALAVSEQARQEAEEALARVLAQAQEASPEALAQARQQAEAHERRAESLQEELAEVLERLQAAEAAQRTLQEQLAQGHAELDGVRRSLLAAEERAAEVEAMLETVESRAVSEGQPSEALEQELRVAQEQVTAYQAEVDLLKRSLRETEERLERVADEADQRVAQALASAGVEPAEPHVDPETERLAFQDVMTGLPNQNIIRRYLDYTLKQVERYDRTTALLCVDLDRFKVINDALGYKAGDEVLLQVAERLQSVVRESDVLGRRGEDEFSILLSEVSGVPDPANQIAIVAKRIFEVLAQPFHASGQKVYVGASIGISTSPGDANTAEEMIEHANSAMLRAKELGRGRYQFFTEDMQARNESRLRLEAELRTALERKELILLYQPIVQVSSGRLVGVEALMRWHHPEFGLVGPDHFLEAAEDTGLIVPMGRWAILQACERLADWSRKGLDLFVTLNLSTRQFLQADLAATLVRSVEVTGAPVQNVVLEIPESIQTLDPSRVEPILTGLRQVGVRLAIDRFGTGFSSLERLHSELAAFLKIDRKFILNTPHNSQCVSIAAAAMGLARSLRLRPIAVGVENEAQLTFCRQMDCEMVQGNLIYTPVEADLITDLARSGRVIR